MKSGSILRSSSARSAGPLAHVCFLAEERSKLKLNLGKNQTEISDWSSFVLCQFWSLQSCCRHSKMKKIQSKITKRSLFSNHNTSRLGYDIFHHVITSLRLPLLKLLWFSSFQQVFNQHRSDGNLKCKIRSFRSSTTDCAWSRGICPTGLETCLLSGRRTTSLLRIRRWKQDPTRC